MRKILISISIIGITAAIVLSAATTYFSDTETSTGNSFSAGGVTHYYGTAWFVPTSVNNVIQGDSIKADISFEIVQARHNDPADSFNP